MFSTMIGLFAFPKLFKSVFILKDETIHVWPREENDILIKCRICSCENEIFVFWPYYTDICFSLYAYYIALGVAEIRAEVLGVGLHHLVAIMQLAAEHQALVEEAGEYYKFMLCLF